MFAELEAGCLLPVPGGLRPADLHPGQGAPRLPRRGRQGALLGPRAAIGRHLEARADSELVKLYSVGAGGGRLVKTHPRQPPGGRSTDPADLPEHKAGYAMRDLTRLIAICAGHGPNIGIYAERLLDDPLPWTRMRSVYRLQGLVTRYGPEPVETACSRALDLDVVSACRRSPRCSPRPPRPSSRCCPPQAGTGHNTRGGRFARDPGEYARPSTTPDQDDTDQRPAHVDPRRRPRTRQPKETTDDHHHEHDARARHEEPGRSTRSAPTWSAPSRSSSSAR